MGGGGFDHAGRGGDAGDARDAGHAGHVGHVGHDRHVGDADVEGLHDLAAGVEDGDGVTIALDAVGGDGLAVFLDGDVAVGDGEGPLLAVDDLDDAALGGAAAGGLGGALRAQGLIEAALELDFGAGPGVLREGGTGEEEEGGEGGAGVHGVGSPGACVS